MTDTIKGMAATRATMESLGLKNAATQVSKIIMDAEKDKLAYRELLDRVMDAELAARNDKHRRRNLVGAHFPPNAKRLDEFDTAELDDGLSCLQLAQLKDLVWLDAHANIIFLGPPGLGKTMLAVGLGLEAIDRGYLVCFEKMVSLVRILDDERVDRNAAFRLKRIRKCDFLIIDEVGYLSISRDQANRFFSLVSDVNERASIIVTTNKEVGQWAEVLQDPVLTSALLDRLLGNARCFSLKGKSYRLKHPVDPMDNGGSL